MSKLPNRLIPIPNADKQFHEKWTKDRNILNFPHPYRAVFVGPPNTGKSTSIKNIIIRADPPFERIVVIHVDADGTQEYNDLEFAEIMDSIPAPTEFDGEVKTGVIIDDIDYKALSKPQKSALDRLFGYVSTHKNVSTFATAQNPMDMPVSCRRCANIFVISKMHDKEAIRSLGAKVGIDPEHFRRCYGMLDEPFDSLWIDGTKKTPYQIRLNGFRQISKKREYSDDEKDD
jgi:hypothetical protein